MNSSFLERIIDWSEVWGPLIPLFIILLYRRFTPTVKPLVYYVFIAIFLTIVATLIAEFHHQLPTWLRNNNVYYNLHSIIRVFFFSWFILSAGKNTAGNIQKILLVAYFLFVVIDGLFIHSPLFLNTDLFVGESIILIILCLLFFFKVMRDDSETDWLRQPAFLVCVGLSIYEAASFFIFLFFYPLVISDWKFGYLTMSIYNLVYVVLCVILAIVLYKSRIRK